MRLHPAEADRLVADIVTAAVLQGQIDLDTVTNGRADSRRGFPSGRNPNGMAMALPIFE
ncbi:MAG: hypothetical protein ACK5Q5_15985 [Planctomycetaceae bacterium]